MAVGEMNLQVPQALAGKLVAKLLVGLVGIGEAAMGTDQSRVLQHEEAGKLPADPARRRPPIARVADKIMAHGPGLPGLEVRKSSAEHDTASVALGLHAKAGRGHGQVRGHGEPHVGFAFEPGCHGDGELFGAVTIAHVDVLPVERMQALGAGSEQRAAGGKALDLLLQRNVSGRFPC